MELASCPVCGQLYMKGVIEMCPKCLAQEEKNERIVAEYVRTHHRCTVEEVHEVTGIKENVIYRMIENGHLQECENLYYPCEQCKKIINKGRLCKICMEFFLDQVKEMKAKEEKVENRKNGYQSAGMYTKNYDEF
jgi:hypothetical protein